MAPQIWHPPGLGRGRGGTAGGCRTERAVALPGGPVSRLGPLGRGGGGRATFRMALDLSRVYCCVGSGFSGCGAEWPCRNAPRNAPRRGLCGAEPGLRPAAPPEAPEAAAHPRPDRRDRPGYHFDRNPTSCSRRCGCTPGRSVHDGGSCLPPAWAPAFGSPSMPCHRSAPATAW